MALEQTVQLRRVSSTNVDQRHGKVLDVLVALSLERNQLVVSPDGHSVREPCDGVVISMFQSAGIRKISPGNLNRREKANRQILALHQVCSLRGRGVVQWPSTLPGSGHQRPTGCTYSPSVSSMGFEYRNLMIVVCIQRAVCRVVCKRPSECVVV